MAEHRQDAFIHDREETAVAVDVKQEEIDRLRAEVARLRGTLEAVRNIAVDRFDNDEDDEGKE